MFDIAIAGAGPAGSFAALLLARAGYRVMLAGQEHGQRRLEGASARTLSVLAQQGIRPQGLLGRAQRSSDWPGLADGVGDEMLIERLAFDRSLRRAASAAGVCFAAETVNGQSAGAWRHAHGELRARVLVDARGRRAPALPARVRAPLSIAIAGHHRQTRRAPSEPWTRVCATPLGWLWQAGWGRGAAWTQIMVDANRLRATPGGAGQTANVGPVWQEFFDQPLFDGPLTLPTRWRARAASIALNPVADIAATPLRIGDAAVALDPLSGHGLFWALSSALHIVPVVRALFDGRVSLAQRFHEQRVRETFLRQARVGRDFHRLAGAAFETDFWTTRMHWPDDAPTHADVSTPRLDTRVIVRDGQLESAEVVRTRFEPDGVAFVHGLEIAPLIHRLSGNADHDPDRVIREFAPALDRAGRQEISGWLKSRGIIDA